ncbi:hypothetical protein BDV95DRAFT_597829 [Massariosphaeria phaeospora]|uniref:Piwi domain-containing protein n=1 Tax=Massariosphaeria phaeospora TaxID=100035 RepID=A0A7C8I0Q3_9PLEO|nr:hypothetical protein BDV95DRAFT_597829 [Massariosphaeria phaeospora]
MVDHDSNRRNEGGTGRGGNPQRGRHFHTLAHIDGHHTEQSSLDQGSGQRANPTQHSHPDSGGGDQAGPRQTSHGRGQSTDPALPVNSDGRGGCYNCGDTGHFARHCPSGRGRGGCLGGSRGRGIPTERGRGGLTVRGRGRPTIRAQDQPDHERRSGHPFPNYVNTNNPEAEMHYPPPSNFNPEESTNNGANWALPKEMHDRTRIAKLTNPQHPIRKEFFTSKKTILTNHFDYGLSSDATFYEYQILGLPGSNKKRTKALFKSAIEHWSFLRRNQGQFATNYVDIIVSWKNLHKGITTRRVLSSTGDPAADVIWEELTIPDGNIDLALRFKLIGTLNLSGLQGYAAAKPENEHINFDSVAKCLNMVISKSFDNRVHQQSSNKFFVKNARGNLWHGNVRSSSASLELIRGYYYTVKPGMGNIILNFNLATSAFFRPILVSEFLSDRATFPVLDLDGLLKGKRVWIEYDRVGQDAEDTARLNSEKSRLKQFEALSTSPIKSLTFYKKIKGQDGKFAKNPDGSFQCETTPRSVLTYLRTTFNQHINPDRKAVNVGNANNQIWYAQEHLRIVPYQIYSRPLPEHLTGSMVTQAAKTPEQGRALIEQEGLRTLGFTASSTAQHSFNQRSDIPITLQPTMLRVPARTLPFPQPMYDQPKPVKGQSRWKMRDDMKFFRTTPKAKLRYLMLRSPDISDKTMDLYNIALREYIHRCGVDIKQGQFESINSSLLRSTIAAPVGYADIMSKFEEAKKANVDLVVLVLPRHTQCGPGPAKAEYMTNVMMKVNLKFEGINHTIQEVGHRLSDHTMVLGADVVHAGPGAFPGTPSIAAIVGSVDEWGTRCLGSMRLQRIDKTDHEERLEDWWEENHRETLPTNIIYYRDGVSSGQYDEVKRIEIAAIRTAYRAVALRTSQPHQEVNITAVVVGKRHHTRFYPLPGDQGDKFGNGNCLPGTNVDKLVTSPYYQDFYLQSHSGFKGTARPTHYFVLEDGIRNLSLDDLCQLTHRLCYSYVRAPGGVSYASPTYYADRLCERGRMYLCKYFIGDDRALGEDLKAFKQRVTNELKAAQRQRFGTNPQTDIQKKELMDQEREDRQTVTKREKEEVYARIRRDFYMFKDDRGCDWKVRG